VVETIDNERQGHMRMTTLTSKRPKVILKTI